MIDYVCIVGLRGGSHTYLKRHIVVVQSPGHVQFFVSPWTPACQATLTLNISWSSLKLISIELVMPSNHLILCCPLLLLPSILPSIRVFSNESAVCIRWPKYWSFSISPSKEYSGLISVKIYWFDPLAFQGTPCFSRVFSSTAIGKHQFFGTLLS